MAEHGLSAQQVAEFRQVFDMFTDGGDEIASERLGEVIRNLGMSATDAEIQDMIDEADEDGSGAIDFDEFLAMMGGRLNSGISDEELGKVFYVMSKGAQFISHASLKAVLASLDHEGSELPEEEIESMFVEVVGAGDRISIDDFILFVKSIIKC